MAEQEKPDASQNQQQEQTQSSDSGTGIGDLLGGTLDTAREVMGADRSGGQPSSGEKKD